MGALIGCCIFGIFIILMGVFFLKQQKKKMAIFQFLSGGLFFILGLVAILISANQTNSQHYTYSKFKSDYKKAVKVCNVPYTLEKDLRKGANGYIAFLTDTTVLHITENKNKEIDGFNVSISGNKTDGFFDDSNYAIAVVCAIEDFDNPNDALDFINSVLDLPMDKYITGKSKYKYSHGLQDENSIGFNISKNFMTWGEAVK